MSLRDKIITSETAHRMLATITPIYDESYVGLWMQEAIGREYDSLLEIVNTLQAQLSPATATWGIELWEQRYGIAVDESLSLDERRQRIAMRLNIPKPLTPTGLRNRIHSITGRWAVIVEHVADYTFGIYLESSDEQPPLIDYQELISYINRHKPAHMSYELSMNSTEKILARVETAYWRIHYPMTGTITTGTWPDTSTQVKMDMSALSADTQAQGYVYDYMMCGTAYARQ